VKQIKLKEALTKKCKRLGSSTGSKRYLAVTMVTTKDRNYGVTCYTGVSIFSIEFMRSDPWSERESIIDYRFMARASIIEAYSFSLRGWVSF